MCERGSVQAGMRRDTSLRPHQRCARTQSLQRGCPTRRANECLRILAREPNSSVLATECLSPCVAHLFRTPLSTRTYASLLQVSRRWCSCCSLWLATNNAARWAYAERRNRGRNMSGTADRIEGLRAGIGRKSRRGAGYPRGGGEMHWAGSLAGNRRGGKQVGGVEVACEVLASHSM